MLKLLKKAKNLGNRTKKDKKKRESAPPDHFIGDTETRLRHTETDDPKMHEIETESHNDIKISGYHVHPDTQKSHLGPEQDKRMNIYIHKMDKPDMDMPEAEDPTPKSADSIDSRRAFKELTVGVQTRHSPKKKSQFSKLAAALDRGETLADVAQEDAEIHTAIVVDINDRAEMFATRSHPGHKTVVWGTSPSFGGIDPLPFKVDDDEEEEGGPMAPREMIISKEQSKEPAKESPKDAMKESITKNVEITQLTERTQTTKASFQDEYLSKKSMRAYSARSCCAKFWFNFWEIARVFGEIFSIFALHAIILFASHSYEKKLIRWLLNFPLLAFFLSYAQVYVMHYVVERGLTAKLRSLNLGYIDKLSYSKFAIIKMSHKILLLIVTTLLQLGTGFLVYVEAISFNMLTIVLSCTLNILMNLMIWWLIYMRKDQSENKNKDQHRYMLKKQLNNLSKVHEDLLNEFQQTKKMLQLREESNVIGIIPGSMVGVSQGILYAFALDAMEGTTIRLDAKLNFQEEYATASKNFTSAFLMLLYSLIQFLAQTQYIRLFGVFDDNVGKVVGLAIGYMLISDIPSVISGVLPYWRAKKKIDEIISVVITAAVFRFIALEFSSGNDLIAVVVIKIGYKLIRVFYRIIYYSVVRQRLVLKLIKKKTAEFNGLYTPDLLEKEEASVMDSMEKFTAYQFAEMISITVFLLAIVTNRYAFDSTILFTLDMSAEYFKYFWIVALVELGADFILILVQMSVLKCSKFTGTMKLQKIKMILDGVKQNFKLLLMINLFCYFALYFYYSNRNELE